MCVCMCVFVCVCVCVDDRCSWCRSAGLAFAAAQQTRGDGGVDGGGGSGCASPKTPPCAARLSRALSAGEAESYGVVRGVGIGMGLQALYRDVGLTLPLHAWTDSSAAIGVAVQQGLGKLRHFNSA